MSTQREFSLCLIAPLVPVGVLDPRPVNADYCSLNNFWLCHAWSALGERGSCTFLPAAACLS